MRAADLPPWKSTPMTLPRDPLEWIDDELAELGHQGLLRAPTTHDGPQQVCLQFGQQQLVNFGSNDYLGLASDPRLAAAAAEAALLEGTGAGASPLVTGHAAAHRRLEDALAAFEQTPRAVIFNSGYAANVGTIAALVGRGDAIHADQKNHASLIDGCRLSRADVRVYPHGDWRALADQLAHGRGFRRRLIVTESVFSMDGDLAPLVELANLADQFDCMLLLDEAHATGVLGTCGRGLAEQLGLESRVQVRIGTLSKALGCAGGFVCGSERLIEWLINRARTYVFSTALPPATCAAALAALAIVREEPQRRVALARRAATLRQRLREQGWPVGQCASQIIPLVVGDPARATRLSRQLRQRGLLVPAIRPPSVPQGESLLRISLTYAHSDAMIERLLQALAALRAESGTATVEA
jgi:8-amino-7-oxononanoate synthase